MIFRTEVILETDDVRVRILALEAGQATAWHFHSIVSDRMLGLEGTMVVELLDPPTVIDLGPGARCEVSAGQTHRVVNHGSATAHYLLIQGDGNYDFNIVDPLLSPG